MPTWLVHGFRWPRPLIRIHIILQNLDDAAAEWLMAPATTATLLENFGKLYKEPMQALASLRFIEQYDPEDITTTEQPYAYVCDQVHEVQLGVDIDDVRGKGVANEAWTSLAELRDQIAPGEKIGWFVVVNGDVERSVPSAEDADESQTSPVSHHSFGRIDEEEEDRLAKQAREPRGLKKWWNLKARKSKSSKDLRGTVIQATAPTNTSRNGSVSSPKKAAPTTVTNGRAPVQASNGNHE